MCSWKTYALDFKSALKILSASFSVHPEFTKLPKVSILPSKSSFRSCPALRVSCRAICHNRAYTSSARLEKHFCRKVAEYVSSVYLQFFKLMTTATSATVPSKDWGDSGSLLDFLRLAVAQFARSLPHWRRFICKVKGKI